MRVLLINPPSPERLGAPLLGFQYVAAALLRRGCEVRVLDAAARHFDRDAGWILSEAEGFSADIIGVALFTRWVWHAYKLVEHLKDADGLLVAGGAHASMRPEEALSRGFDAAIVGEAEQAIVALVEAIERGTPFHEVPGIRLRPPGSESSPVEYIENLDDLAPPWTCQELFDPLWYDPSGSEAVPGGVLTSRGCPASCTFCANYVTGRRFRFRSAQNVVSELNAWNALTGATFFPFWDDALTANIPRLSDLCAAIEHDVRFPLAFSAATRANLVSPQLLRAMKNAGLAHLTFGVESGDDRILRVIRKGTTTSQVVRALEWSKEEGLSTACSFMLGFPEDTPASLERTARFMERIAPLVDSFGTLGVVIPFPGTPLYEANHSRYGFTDWWLREEYSRYTAFPPVTDVERFHRHYIDDANLELDFFRYGSGTRDLIRACLKIKGEHNLRKIGLFRDSAIQSPPSVEPASWDHPDTARYFEQFTRCHTRYLAANRALVRHAALAPGQRLLDFGAGTGGTSACALEQIGSDGRIDCVEPAGAMRQIGQTKFDARVRWFAGLPPDTERYDRILCGAAIWQVPDLKLCIRNLVSRLMPGGAICFNIPAAYVGLPDGPGGGRDPWLTELPASLVRRVPAAILPQRPRLRLPSPSELSGLLESCGLVACSWSYTGRLTQKSYRDWLKIPVISDLLLGSHNPDRRADLIDQAYLETDPASWRPERWLGWTAWKPPFAIEPLHDASSRLNDRASLVELARQDGYIYLTRLVPLQTVLGLRSRLLAICSRLGLVDSRGRWCGGSLGVCPGDRPHSDPRWIRLQQEALVLEEFRALEDHPAIRTVLENILGDDVNGGQGSVCRLAPPGAPATGPHRDYQYLGRSTSLWTAWLPLGYCPMALGPLAVLPGSHRLSGSTCGEDADEAAWLAADMAPGDVLLFNALTLHRACPNVTQRRVRISADFRYAPHCS